MLRGANERSPQAHKRLVLLRERLAEVPSHSSLKAVMRARGVPIRGDVRAPLRGLTDPERPIALEAARTVGALGS